MFRHELEHCGRLAIFKFEVDGNLAVTASGYLLHEENQARLYLVSLTEVKLSPPRRLTHLAVARFAKELRATYLVPVDHQAGCDRVSSSALEGGFIPVLTATSFDLLVAKLSQP